MAEKLSNIPTLLGLLNGGAGPCMDQRLHECLNEAGTRQDCPSTAVCMASSVLPEVDGGSSFGSSCECLSPLAPIRSSGRVGSGCHHPLRPQCCHGALCMNAQEQADGAAIQAWGQRGRKEPTGDLSSICDAPPIQGVEEARLWLAQRGITFMFQGQEGYDWIR